MTILLTNSKGSSNIADTWNMGSFPDGVDVSDQIETGDFPASYVRNYQRVSSSIITTVSVVVWGYSGSLRS